MQEQSDAAFSNLAVAQMNRPEDHEIKAASRCTCRIGQNRLR
jgi:hypothetical protein